jgi:twitching motility protein PilT
MKSDLPQDSDLDALVRELNEQARREESAGRSDERAGIAAAVSGPPPAADGPAESAVDAAGPDRGAVRAAWVLPGTPADARRRLDELLVWARERDASDVLLVAGAPPVARIHGALVAVSDEPLPDHAVADLCAALTPPERRATLSRLGAVDFSIGGASIGRLRCNVHRERGRWAAAVRLLPGSPPPIEELGLPRVVERFAGLEHGLVLVTGTTGSGKSTTIAALLRRILERRRVHAITIEDPVEYEHRGCGSLVEHVEIGRDALSFASALRSALRQDPDVIVVGEMRDPESISMAITAAETGHLVLSSLHTGDVPQTINRILDSYPAGQLEALRTQLSVSLAGIIAQTLIPRGEGDGRVPAAEVLLASDAVRSLIRLGKIERLRNQIGLEHGAGMISFNRCLADLVRRKVVQEHEARVRARDPEEFESFLRHGGGA